MVFLLLLLIVSFGVQNFLSLIRLPLFIFAFISFVLGDRLKKISAVYVKGVLPMCSRSFMVSGLTSRSFTYLEFIFIYGVRKCSNFILLHITIQCHIKDCLFTIAYS